MPYRMPPSVGVPAGEAFVGTRRALGALAALTLADAACGGLEILARWQVGLWLGTQRHVRHLHGMPDGYGALFDGLLVLHLLLAVGAALAVIAFSLLPEGLPGRLAARLAALTAVAHAAAIVIVTISVGVVRSEGLSGGVIASGLGPGSAFQRADNALQWVVLSLIVLAAWQVARAVRAPTGAWVHVVVAAVGAGATCMSWRALDLRSGDIGIYQLVFRFGIPLLVALGVCLPLARRLGAGAPRAPQPYAALVPELPGVVGAIGPLLAALGGMLAIDALGAARVCLRLVGRALHDTPVRYGTFQLLAGRTADHLFFAGASAVLAAILVVGCRAISPRSPVPPCLALGSLLSAALAMAVSLTGDLTGPGVAGPIVDVLFALSWFGAAATLLRDPLTVAWSAQLPAFGAFVVSCRRLVGVLGVVAVARLSTWTNGEAGYAWIAVPAVALGVLLFVRLLPVGLEAEASAQMALDRQESAIAKARETSGHLMAPVR